MPDESIEVLAMTEAPPDWQRRSRWCHAQGEEWIRHGATLAFGRAVGGFGLVGARSQSRPKRGTPSLRNARTPLRSRCLARRAARPTDRSTSGASEVVTGTPAPSPPQSARPASRPDTNHT